MTKTIGNKSVAKCSLCHGTGLISSGHGWLICSCGTNADAKLARLLKTQDDINQQLKKNEAMTDDGFRRIPTDSGAPTRRKNLSLPHDHNM